MSEWRGTLHPRDRKGQFRRSLERLAAGIEPGQKVDFGTGKIGRNRRGYWTTEVEGHPTGIHKSPRSAVTRAVGVGAASPGITAVKGAKLGVKDARGNEIRMGDRVRWTLSRPDGSMYDMGRGEVIHHDSRMGLQVTGSRNGLRPSDVVVVDAKASPGIVAIRNGIEGRRKAAEREAKEKAEERAAKLPEFEPSGSGMARVSGHRGWATPGKASPGVGNVRGYSLPGEKSKITPAVRARMETRNIAYASGFKGDRVASAADALVQLYRAQEGDGSGAAALKRVNETWRGLDLAERARARRVAQHMHDAGSNLLRPRQTRVA